MGEGSFRCSLYLSPKVLEVSSMYSSSQERSPHWHQYMAPLLLTIGPLSLGDTSRFLIVLLPLKWVCMPYLPQIFLILSHRPCVQGMTMWPLVLTSLVAGWAPVVPWLLALSEASLEGLLSILSTLSKAHLVYSWGGSSLCREAQIATNCLGPMEKGVDNTKLCWEVVVTVPL